MGKNFKRKLKKVTAGLLAVCIVLGNPLNAAGSEENAEDRLPAETGHSVIEETGSYETSEQEIADIMEAKSEALESETPESEMRKPETPEASSDFTEENAPEGQCPDMAKFDTDAPVLRDMYTDSKCYEPTKTDTEQYFSEDFVLKGSFGDEGSGIGKIEYTANAGAGRKAVWKKAENHEDGSFSITLADGVYDALAVRAYDNAGNVSEAKGFANRGGEFIKVVVDKAAPVLDVKGVSGGKAYSGENDNWTNKDVALEISIKGGSCQYAGIYKCEYAYDKIGDAVNREDMTCVSENWTELDFDSDGQKCDKNIKIEDDKNGYYYFRAISKSGVVSEMAAKERILVQHEAAEIKPMIVNGADESKRKNEWYNKASGVPAIKFEYPDYDTGVTSKEYDAPVTIHYRLAQKVQGNDAESISEKSASIGIMSSSDLEDGTDGMKKFVLAKENLDGHAINFGCDERTGEAEDGIYTLEYWITDKAGNVSEKQTRVYKIDCHEPTELAAELAGSQFEVGNGTDIVYEKFYKNSISGHVSAEYGISGKGSLTVLKAKKIGEWELGGGLAEDIDDSGIINVGPNKRCFLYVRAEDEAGNVSEGWTNGFVVDNMAPNEACQKELIIEPKGANEHGFFNRDVTVEISIKDSPEDDNCAALATVTSSIGKDGKTAASGNTLFSFTKELPTDAEISAASSFECVQVVSAKDNEGNDACIEVTAADRSGNTKTSVQRLKIDVTAPKIDISFDNNDAEGGSFFRSARTADIHVQELNFDASRVDIRVTKDGQPYSYALSDWTGDGTERHAFITFAEDGEYTIEADCTDLADNKSETAKAGAFTIDCTAPVLAVDINADGSGFNKEGYFNGTVTAFVTVNERNFDPSGLSLEAAASSKGAWSHDGDVHTMQLSFDRDSTYDIECIFTDKAGNVSESVSHHFVIDTQAPQIAISGVADGAAINGEVTPVVTVLDLNMDSDGAVITLATGIGETADVATITAPANGNGAKGYSYTLADINGKPDNVYYLTATARDSAGNESSLTYRFSLNRNGSAYDLAGLMEIMGRRYVTYAGLEDIKIVEMNIDMVDEFAVYVSRNGELGYSAKYGKEVKGSADTGYTYIYSIKKDNFKDEGIYKLTLYSKDRAGNEINNKKSINGDAISFIVDNTAPKVVIDGMEAGMIYDVEPQEAHVSVTDNFKLAEAEFSLVNKEGGLLESWDYMALCGEGGQMAIALPQYDGEVSLIYRVKDAAGNEVQTFQDSRTALADILVTTDKLVQALNNPAKTMAGRLMPALAGVMMAAVAIFANKRRKKKL